MTISYQDRFFKLLLRWKGSLWKTIWQDLALFMILYYAINFVYRFALTDDSRRHFQGYVHLFDDYTSQIPLTFLLGFYVAMVIRRWWEQFQFISWPDDFLLWVGAFIKRNAPEERIIRRVIARYCMLTSVLAWRSVSVRVLKRFPTDEHLLKAGLITEAECSLLNKVDIKVDPHKNWFIPLVWIQTLLTKCLEQRRIEHSNELRDLLHKLDEFRRGFFQLFLYDWVTIPLVYTQVATIAVYGYFAMCLIGRQFPQSSNCKEQVDMYVPIFTILQFIFYVGWLKVGEDLIFPFGDDDEDFEFNYILDRNLEMSYLLVDELHMQMPPLYSDALNADGINMVYTKGSVHDNHPQRRHLEKYELHIAPEEMSLAEDMSDDSGRTNQEEPAKFKKTFRKTVRRIVSRGSDRTTDAEPSLRRPLKHTRSRSVDFDPEAHRTTFTAVANANATTQHSY